MTNGRADGRSQLIVWAMAEANRLRRQAKPTGANTTASESSWGQSPTKRGREAAVGAQPGERGDHVVDWQMPAGVGPESFA